MIVRHSDVLADFVAYCEAHPTQRFWQALRNWSGHNFILASDRLLEMQGLEDTFYWNERAPPQPRR